MKLHIGGSPGGCILSEVNMTKKLEKGSAWEKYEMDGDGVVTDEELDMERRMIELEDLKCYSRHWKD